MEPARACKKYLTSSSHWQPPYPHLSLLLYYPPTYQLTTCSSSQLMLWAASIGDHWPWNTLCSQWAPQPFLLTSAVKRCSPKSRKDPGLSIIGHPHPGPGWKGRWGYVDGACLWGSGILGPACEEVACSCHACIWDSSFPVTQENPWPWGLACPQGWGIPCGTRASFPILETWLFHTHPDSPWVLIWSHWKGSLVSCASCGSQASQVSLCLCGAGACRSSKA